MSATDDLTITLRYMTAAAHKRYGLERSDPSDTSPGWFVGARSNEGYTVNRKLSRVTAQQAVGIATQIESCFPGEDYIVNAVEAQNAAHNRERQERKERAEQALAEAQDELKRIAAEEDDA
jgi:hypothetical protein